MNKKFLTTIRHNHIIINEEMQKCLKSFKDDTPVEISFGKVKDYRSTQQNKYYFGVIVKTLSDELGYFPDEIHEILKSMFLKKVALVKGQEIIYSQSTSSLKTDAFEDYMAKIRIWAASTLNIQILEPNESIW